MIIIWGSRLYGRADEVPGLFHVATRFGHLWFIPLIPMGSHLVLGRNAGRFVSVPLGLDPKSMLLAWGRTGSLFGGIAAGVAAMIQAGEPRPGPWWIPAIVSVLLLALSAALCFAKPFRYASYRRAVELSEKAGFNDEGKVRLEAIFGNISQQEAAELIEVARQQTTGHPATHPPLAR